MRARGRAPGAVLFAVAGAVLALDQMVKAAVTRALEPGSSVVVVPGWLSLTHLQNTGIAFGLLRGVPLGLLLALALTVIFLVFYNWTRSDGPRTALEQAALGALAGGAAGNAVDRLRLGYVIDYLDLHVWPVFNLADAAVVTASVLLLVAAVRPRARRDDPRVGGGER